MNTFAHHSLDNSSDARPFFLVLASFLPIGALANPQGPVVQSGSASFSTSGAHTQITASHNAVLNWQSFHLAPGQSATFVQPSASSVVWNRILGGNPSEIHGSITANGVVVLMNQAGFHFGPSSFVSAAGLVVSTAPATPIESGAGLFWQFNGAPPGVSIVNYGHLQVGQGGSAFLIADHIANHGSITAPGGTIGLAAGREVLLSERPDGRGLSANVQLPSGSVDNSGRLVADAGAVAPSKPASSTKPVCIQANAVRERNGVIELYSHRHCDQPRHGSAGSTTPPSDRPRPRSNVDVNSAFVGVFAHRDAGNPQHHARRWRGIWDLASSTGRRRSGQSAPTGSR
jgi:filamentous hemagglutinin family protein